MANKKSMGVWVGVMVGVAIAAAIVMTVALDVDQTKRDVTTYEYVTTTTGLFEYDKTPQYIDYDLSKNYTGYYTTLSDPYWGGVGTNGDGYYASEQVNRYPLNIAPLSTYSQDLNLRDSALSNKYSGGAVYTYKGTGQFDYYYDATTAGLRIISLKDYITEQNLNTYTSISFTVTSGSPVLFISSQDNTATTSGTFRGDYTLAEYAEYHQTGLNPDIRPLIAPLSANYNVITGVCAVYSSPTVQDSTTYLRSIDLEDALIVFSSASATSPNPYGYQIHVEAEQMQPAQYLDISKGVRVSP